MHRPTHRGAAEQDHNQTLRVAGIVVMATALTVPAAALAATSSFSGKAGTDEVSGRNLVVNGSFEAGQTGWRTTAKTQKFTVVKGGHSGTRYAKLGTAGHKGVALKGAVNSTEAGATYRVTAWLKTNKPKVRGELRTREVRDHVAVTTHRKFALRNRRWTKFGFNVTTTRDGATLGLNVVTRKLKRGTVVGVDGVSMVQLRSVPTSTPTVIPTTLPTDVPTVIPSSDPTTTVTVTPTTAPTTATPTSAPTSSTPTSAPTSATPTPTTTPTRTPTTTPTTTPTPPRSTKRLVGIYAGGSRTDDAAVERSVGATFGMRSTYYQPGNTFPSAADKSAMADGVTPSVALTAGKTYLWSDIAAGKYDAYYTTFAKTMAAAKITLPFSFDIEPDFKMNHPGNKTLAANTASGYVAAWRHLHDLIAPIAPNVQFKWWVAGNTGTKGNPELISSLYPGDRYVDVVAWDPYIMPSQSSGSMLPIDDWASFPNWLSKQSFGKGKPLALGEFGIDVSHTKAQRLAYFQGIPAAFDKLNLTTATWFKRSSTAWNFSETDPDVLAALGRSMKAIQK